MTSLGWDTGRAVSTAALVALTGPAVLSVLRRAARRANFDAAAVFTGVPQAREPETAEREQERLFPHADSAMSETRQDPQ